MSPPPTAATGLPSPPRIAAAKPLTPMPAPTSNAVCVSGATASPATAPRPAAKRERRRDHHARVDADEPRSVALDGGGAHRAPERGSPVEQRRARRPQRAVSTQIQTVCRSMAAPNST